MNQSASRLHPKNTDYSASFPTRDELAVIMHNRGRRTTIETISKDCMGVPLRSSHIQLLDRLDQSKLKDQGYYQTRRKRKLLSMQQDASAVSASQASFINESTVPPTTSRQKRKQPPSSTSSSSRKPKLQKTSKRSVRISPIMAPSNVYADSASDSKSDDSDFDMERKYDIPDKPSSPISIPAFVTNNSKPRVYLCSKCHAPKKGHRCMTTT